MMERHSLRGQVLFLFKARLLQLRRALKNSRRPKFERNLSCPELTHLTRHHSPLRTQDDARELGLELGKIQNLRVACASLNGVVLEAGHQFSFWQIIGRATRRRGFVEGRELREGCIIPSVGGGLCQLSNALYDLALKSGATIIERHRHTSRLPGSASELDRDATVFWNYIDLRFSVPRRTQIQARITGSELVVEFWSAEVSKKVPESLMPLRVLNQGLRPNSCMTCGQEGCFEHQLATPLSSVTSRRAYILDAVFPEFRELVQAENAQVFTPWRRASRYDWHVSAEELKLLTIQRPLALRGAKTAPDRRRTTLEYAERFAAAYARRVDYRADSIVTELQFLDTLSKQGVLGGRRVEVWCTTPPLALLHELLDSASAHYPECENLRDFRADPDAVSREMALLREADRVVTAHPFVAKWLGLQGIRGAELIAWNRPSPRPGPVSLAMRYVWFGGPTLGRTGAHALRNVARKMGLVVAVEGNNFEGTDFWSGVTVVDGDSHPMESASVAYFGSVFVNRPAVALKAIALGIPVICTPGVGVDGRHFDFGDEEGLEKLLLEILFVDRQRSNG